MLKAQLSLIAEWSYQLRAGPPRLSAISPSSPIPVCQNVLGTPPNIIHWTNLLAGDLPFISARQATFQLSASVIRIFTSTSRLYPKTAIHPLAPPLRIFTPSAYLKTQRTPMPLSQWLIA